MSYKSKEIREQRAAVAEQMKQLITAAKKENKVLTAEEREKFDTLDKEQLRLQDEAESLERLERFDEINTRSEDKPKSVQTFKAKEPVSQDRAFMGWLKRAAKCLDYAEEKACEGYDLRANDFTFKGSKLQHRATNPQSSIGSNVGIELVPTIIPDAISTFMLATTPVRGIARNWTTPNGDTIAYPVSDDTANVASIISQNTQDVVLTMPFDKVNSVVYCYTSNLILIPYEWIQDSVIDVQAYVVDELARRFARGTSAHLAMGDGSSKPEGYGHAAGTGVTMASASGPTYAELLRWYHSVPLFYRSSANFAFMVSDSMAQAIRGLVDLNGMPIWSPSYNQGLTGPQPDRLFGKPLYVDPALETTGTVAHTVGVCGDFDQFVIRSVGSSSVETVTLKERYADYRQVGLFAFARMGTFCLQPGALKSIKTPAS